MNIRVVHASAVCAMHMMKSFVQHPMQQVVFFSVVLFQPAAFYLDLDLDPARAAARIADEHDALNAAQLCARDADLEPVLFPTMPPCQTPTTMLQSFGWLASLRHACLCAIANTV